MPDDSVVIHQGQATIFDLEEGRARRDEGAATVAANTPSWQEEARQAIGYLAAQGEPFSADDLVELVGMPPHPNSLGAAFVSSSRRGAIRALGYTQGRRPESHARVQRLWGPA